ATIHQAITYEFRHAENPVLPQCAERSLHSFEFRLSCTRRARGAAVQSLLLCCCPTRSVCSATGRTRLAQSSLRRRLRRHGCLVHWAHEEKGFFLAKGKNCFPDLPRKVELPSRARAA